MKIGIKRLLVSNALWNSAGILVAILGGFITAPFLIHHLGTDRYSIWVLVGSLDGYLGLLDLGVRGAIGRNIAFHRSQNDPPALRFVFHSALAIQLVVAAFGVLVTFAAVSLFFHVFAIPPGQVSAARIALLILAAGIIIEFPMCVFDATLWGLNRFDVLNAIDIPAVIARTALTISFIAHGYGLIALAVINVSLTVGTHLAKAVALFILEPSLRDIRPSFEPESTRRLFNWGFWNFVISLCRTVADQAGTVIVGSVIGLSLVTPLSVTTRLIAYASALLVAASDVLTPVATGLHAEGDISRQQMLLLGGGMRCMGIVMFAGAALVFLGGPFLALWIGAHAATGWQLLPILVIGSLLPISQRPSYSIFLAAGKHKVLAISALVENAVSIPIALLVARRYGMVGVCLCLASAAVLNRLVFQMIAGCILTGVSVAKCVWHTIVVPVSTLAIPIAALAMLVIAAPPKTWIQLFLGGAAFSLGSLAAWNFSGLLRGGMTRIHFAPRASPAFSAPVD